MSFLSKLFSKCAADLVEKGEKMLATGHFADARHFFSEAAEKAAAEEGEGGQLSARIAAGLTEAKNRLALLNISEAEALLGTGDEEKASDHLRLAITLAEDGAIREKAEFLLSCPAVDERKSIPLPTHSCGGCGAHQGGESALNTEEHEDYLSEEEKFELLTHPLPGDLSQRYACLGKDFAEAYLAAHAGNDAAAVKTYCRLLAEGENDILLYELAIALHRNREIAECERLLRRAVSLSPANPLCRMALAELLVETGRFPEAVPCLEQMVAESILPDQAGILLGDLHQHMGNGDRAIETYAEVLATPLAKEAAKRLVPILEAANRHNEAVALHKKYLKGCC